MKPTIPENSCLIIQLSYFFRYAVERVNSVRHILPRLVLCTLGACTEFWECQAMREKRSIKMLKPISGLDLVGLVTSWGFSNNHSIFYRLV